MNYACELCALVPFPAIHVLNRAQEFEFWIETWYDVSPCTAMGSGNLVMEHGAHTHDLC
jgi:hypothetical protein